MNSSGSLALSGVKMLLITSSNEAKCQKNGLSSVTGSIESG